jgi:hypothetical protein
MDSNQNSSLFGLSIDATSKAHLTVAARWAKFLAIIGFIMCGLIVLLGVLAGSVFSIFYGEFGGRSGFAGLRAVAAIFYILIALLYFFPCLFLFNFAVKMKAALIADDQDTLNTSFQNLKKTFRFLGVVTIVILSFYVLAVIFGLLADATAGSF